MSKRLHTLVGAVAVLAAGLLPIVLPAAASTAHPEDRAAKAGLALLAEPGADPLSRVGACISGGGQGDVLLLLDKSGSLTATDPTAARVEAAQYLVRQLSNWADMNSAKVAVAVAGFDTRYSRSLGWTALAKGGADNVVAALETYRSQNKGIDTDYWNALNGARRDLSARAASGQHCPFLILFTDGQYRIQPRNTVRNQNELGDPKPYDPKNDLMTTTATAAAVETGQKDICRTGGLADQFRTQNIVTVAVGLSGADKPDFGLIKGMATGQGISCGRITSPAPGAFFLASDIEDLFFTFDRASTPEQPPIVQEGTVCSGTLCPAGTHRFVLDSSIGSVRGLGTSGAAGQSVYVVSPEGKLTELTKGSTRSAQLAGAQLSWQWLSTNSVSFGLHRTQDAAWVGPWGLVFVAPNGGKAVSKSSLHLFGDVAPTWPGASSTTLRVDDPSTELTFGVGHADGSVIDPASLSAGTRLSVSLVLPDGQEVAIAKGLTGASIASPQKVALTAASPGPAVIRLSLDVTTKSWQAKGVTVPGTKLEPQVKDFPVNVHAPAAYPTVPSKVDFGRTESVDPVSKALALTGKGCAWLAGGAEFTAQPDGTSGGSLASPASRPASCAVGSLPLTLTMHETGNGLAAGTIVVMTLPEDRQAKPIPVKVAFQLEMQRPVDRQTLLWVLVLVTLLGLLIPLGLLYLVKYATAKIPGTAIAAGSVRGPVNDSLSFLDGGVPLQVHELTTAVLGSNRRHVSVGGTVLATRTGLAPTEPGYVVVEEVGGPAAGGRSGDQVKGLARLPLAVQGSWCVALDAADPHNGDVQVTFFTAAGGAGWDQLTTQARTYVPQVVAKLRASIPAGSATSATVPDAWDDSAPGAVQSDPWASPATSSPIGTASSQSASSRWRSSASQSTPPVDDSDSSW